MEPIGLSVLSPFILNETQADVKREKNVNGANAYSLMTYKLPTQSEILMDVFIVGQSKNYGG